VTLQRGRISGYDLTRMSFGFTMLDGEREIKCEISSVALNDLAGPRCARNKHEQFLAHRAEIEATAAAVLDLDDVTKVVRIFAKHVKRKQNDDVSTRM
jgi:hypothetical protein